MNTATGIIIRIAFVALLVVGTACSKLDRASLQENARGGRGAEQAQLAEDARVQELRDRVAYLEAQLKDMHELSVKADEPGLGYTD